MRLQTKLLLVLLPTLLASGAAVVIFSRDALHRAVVEEVGTGGIAKAQELADTLASGFHESTESQLLHELFLLQGPTEAAYVLVLDVDGRVLAHTNVVEQGQVYRDAVTAEALQSAQPTMHELQVEEQPVLDVSVPVWAPEDEPLLAGPQRRLGTIRLGLPLQRAQATERRISSRILGVLLAATMAAVLAVLVFVRRLLLPVRHLAEATAALAAGEPDVQVPVRSRDELAELAQAFNRMARDVREVAAATAERAKAAELAEAYRRLDAAHRELQQTQAQLVQAGKLAGLGEIAAGIAHELNQPLTAVLGFAQRLRQPILAMLPERADELELILQSSRRMAEIVNNIRSFARQGEPRLEPVEAWAPLNDALMLLSEQLRLRQIEVVQRPAEGLPQVLADRALLQQVFLNLLGNARDALELLPENRPRRLVLEARREGADVLYVVQDSGPGVAPEIESRIFDPFFTTKEVGRGMGLGLSLSYGIVQMHRGAIGHGRGSEGGASFTVRIPAADAS